MTEQAILEAVQEIFRDNFDDDTLEITRATCADDIEDWDSLEQINLLTVPASCLVPNMPTCSPIHQIQAGRCAQPEKRWRPAGPGCSHGGLR